MLSPTKTVLGMQLNHKSHYFLLGQHSEFVSQQIVRGRSDGFTLNASFMTENHEGGTVSHSVPSKYAA